MDPFLWRALAAGLMLAIVAAPLGCLVVWQRMSYFGETVANASLIGVGVGLVLQFDPTLAAVAVAAMVAGLLTLLARQKAVAMDAVLGVTAHGALALGLTLMAFARGPSVDLMGFLAGDIFAVTARDLMTIGVGGVLVTAIVAAIWRPLLSVAVNDELAAAEGASSGLVKGLFVVLLAAAIAAAIKIVGV